MRLASKLWWCGLLLAAGMTGWACERDQPVACPCADRVLRLATTTSIDNTGLLAELLPPFAERTGIRVEVLAVGTGQALALARNGDVDAVVVHDPAAERAFVAAGHGVNRRRLMHNDFVLVGPAADPAGVAGGRDAVAALRAIHDGGARFVSRGDRSGTHRAELRLWQQAERDPTGDSPPDWYLEVGQGMRPTLNVADQKRAYCLVDRATFLDAEQAVALEVLVEGDPRLHNPYSFIAVNPARHPQAKTVEALAFCGWLTSAAGQRRIGRFRVAGRTLFHPDAIAQSDGAAGDGGT